MSAELSHEELRRMTRESIDPHSLGRITRPHDNANLSNEELIRRIESRNAQGKPTFLLRTEYERRLLDP